MQQTRHRQVRKRVHTFILLHWENRCANKHFISASCPPTADRNCSLWPFTKLRASFGSMKTFLWGWWIWNYGSHQNHLENVQMYGSKKATKHGRGTFEPPLASIWLIFDAIRRTSELSSRPSSVASMQITDNFSTLVQQQENETFGSESYRDTKSHFTYTKMYIRDWILSFICLFTPVIL